jgi:hypothetical protein
MKTSSSRATVRITVELVAACAAIWLIVLPATASLAAQGTDSPDIYLPLVSAQDGTSWRWTESTEVELIPTPRSGPVTALDHLGQPHLFWDTSSAPRFIYHTYYSEAGWSEPAPVAESLGTAELLYAPLVDNEGELHLVWRTDLGSNVENRYRLMYAIFNGSGWADAEEITGSDWGGITAIPHLDGNDKVMVTSVNNDVFGSTAIQFSRTEGWSQTEPIYPGHVVSRIWPDMQGGVHFYGWGSRTDYSYWLDGDFEINKRDVGGQVTLRSTKLDGTRALHVFWTGQVPIPGSTVRGIYYECLNPNLEWSAQEVLSQQNQVPGSPLSYADTSEYVSLVWAESAPVQQVRLALRQGCISVVDTTVPLPPDTSLASIAHNSTDICTIVKQPIYAKYQAVCSKIPRLN